LQPLINIEIKELSFLIFLLFIGNLVRSAQLMKFINILECEIKFINSIALTIGSTLLNYLPMNIGMILKARGLKKSLGISYSHFASIYSVDIILIMFAGSIMGIYSLLFFDGILNDSEYLFLSFIIILIISILFFITPLDLFKNRKGKVANILREFIIGIGFIKNNYINLLHLLVYSTSQLILIALQFILCFQMLGVEISIYVGMLYSAIIALLLIINITPGAIGIRELFVGAIAAITGQSFELGVMASSLYRACALIIHIGLGAPGLLFLKIKKII
jgi:uncharacterized membrane protein YbhN (UPF0104 family)